jgi:hypothetical protein
MSCRLSLTCLSEKLICGIDSTSKQILTYYSNSVLTSAITSARELSNLITKKETEELMANLRETHTLFLEERGVIGEEQKQPLQERLDGTEALLNELNQAMEYLEIDKELAELDEAGLL